MRRRIVQAMLSAAVLLALLLGGCGFQLRGQVQLPKELAVVYIDSVRGVGVPPGTLSRKLEQLLASSGAAITHDRAQATAIITISNESSGRRAVAADRFDVKREYFLIYSAVYQVHLANGKILIEPEGVNVNRALLFDENQVLAFEAAQESLEDSMTSELAWQIVRRLQAQAAKSS